VVAVVGLIIVFGSVLGGFTLAGGPLPVLFVFSEYIIIGGVALGTMLISTPGKVLSKMIKKSIGVLKPRPFDRQLYLDGLKLLYELFQVARRDGLVAIETHIEDPEGSDLFKKYPSVLSLHHPTTFLCDSLRLVLVGSVPPHDLDMLMDAEIDVHHEAEEKPVAALTTVGDALPGIGIVAAVLGIVVTMQSIAGPIEEIGHHVASALVGTFLGILGSYGAVAPIAGKIAAMNHEEGQFYQFFRAAVTAFAKGFAPIIVVEFARRAINADIRPSFTEMEEACKSTKTK
jgi:chemotaxis protein MotA